MNRQKPIIVDGKPVVIHYYLDIRFENGDTDKYRRLRALQDSNTISDEQKEEFAELANKAVTPVAKINSVVLYENYYLDVNNIPRNYCISYADMLTITKACEAIEREVKESTVTLKEYVSQPQDLPF